MIYQPDKRPVQWIWSMANLRLLLVADLTDEEVWKKQNAKFVHITNLSHIEREKMSVWQLILCAALKLRGKATL